MMRPRFSFDMKSGSGMTSVIANRNPVGADDYAGPLLAWCRIFSMAA
jgi:hypothetical protein